MVESTEHAEVFLRFDRRKTIALLLIVAILGTIGLALMLTPVGQTWRWVARASLIPLALSVLVFALLSFRSRRFASDSAEVRVAMADEWRQNVTSRASRFALIVILVVQWPLSLAFGFLIDLPSPRGQMAMAMATITIGIVTQLGAFLFLDRDHE